MASLPPVSSRTSLCQFVDTFHRGEGSPPPPPPPCQPAVCAVTRVLLNDQAFIADAWSI